MRGSTKVMFARAPKRIRRLMHQLSKHPKPKLVLKDH